MEGQMLNKNTVCVCKKQLSGSVSMALNFPGPQFLVNTAAVLLEKMVTKQVPHFQSNPDQSLTLHDDSQSFFERPVSVFRYPSRACVFSCSFPRKGASLSKTKSLLGRPVPPS